MTARRSFGHPALVGVALLLAAAFAATAQPAQQSGPMQGFQVNRDQPVKIESNTLEVRDKSKQATFLGDVKLTQGDTTLQCKTLVVFYEDTSPPAQAGKKAAPAAQKTAGPGGGSQQIKRVEAKGDVLVTQKDQTAKGDNGVFDLKSNSITLTGNVVVTQGQNVLRGERMVVDLTTGVSRVESGQSKSGETKRVEGLFNPSSVPKDPQKDAKPAPPPPAAKSSPGTPTRVN